MKNKVRVYRFYNIEKSAYGVPFPMCDKHYKLYKPSVRISIKIEEK